MCVWGKNLNWVQFVVGTFVVKKCFSFLRSCIFGPYLFLSFFLSLCVTHTHTHTHTLTHSHTHTHSLSGPQGTVCIVSLICCYPLNHSLLLGWGPGRAAYILTTQTPTHTHAHAAHTHTNTGILAHPHLLCFSFTHKGVIQVNNSTCNLFLFIRMQHRVWHMFNALVVKCCLSDCFWGLGQCVDGTH